MNLPENETEDVVSRIKERKMARLFENVKMDIQAERRKAAEAERKLEMARSEAQREVAEARRELERVRSEGTRGFEICRYIARKIRKNCAESEIMESLMQEFSLNREQAEEEYRKIMEE